MPDEFKTVAHVYQLITELCVQYSFQILGAVVIMMAGFWTARLTGNALLRLQERRGVDITLRQFITSAVRIVVIALFGIVALSKLGISITPLIAAIGGVSLGAGFALQGLASNYGAGLSLILTRPFKVGDTIELLNCEGIVTEINLSTTVLSSEDGEIIAIPNKKIVGEIYRNSFGNRLVEGKIGISYTADPAEATRLVVEALKEIEELVMTPAPHVGIEAFGEKSISIAYRYWVPTTRYFELRHAVNSAVYRTLTVQETALLPQREPVAALKVSP